MSRKLKAPSTRRSVTKVSRRARNLERRFLPPPPALPDRVSISDTLYYFDSGEVAVPNTQVQGYSLIFGGFRFMVVKAIALSGYAPVGSFSYIWPQGFFLPWPNDDFSPMGFGLCNIAGVTRHAFLQDESGGDISLQCFTAISTIAPIGDNTPATATAGDVFFSGQLLISQD